MINLCLSELCRCQQLSPRANFIILLGDRYGWRPAAGTGRRRVRRLRDGKF
jgi:hypothetical protein